MFQFIPASCYFQANLAYNIGNCLYISHLVEFKQATEGRGPKEKP